MTRETMEEALQRASFYLKEAGVERPRDEAELLLAWVTGRERLRLFLERHGPLSEEAASVFENAWRRRCTGEPLAYITGCKEFFGLDFIVTRHVLVPRPETEFVVEAALEWVRRQGRPRGEGITAVDLGTGSGILAVTLARHLEAACFLAVDLSPEALRVAAKNAARHGVAGRIRWYRGDFFGPFNSLVPRPRFNLVVANPPYISREELAALPPAVSRFEPRISLDGGGDGLDAYRRLLQDLPRYLRSPGFVALETGAGQARAVEGLCRELNLFRSIACRRDYRGLPRVLEGSA